ncbi:RDD family protein [Wolbachia endosymbiont (group E) of Neria commutata]|uniref:RDD family protein n=1 Tax=Wolbachia endosymbiont (group E) of Neria commutata TaxID=3066149 RepID=UPI00397D2AA1
MDTKVNYAGVTRRVIAGTIDGVIMLGILPFLCSALLIILLVAFESNELAKNSVQMADDFFESNISLITFVIFIFFKILEMFMIIRFSGTPGQLLCGIRIKDASTFKNVTIMQAVIRCVSRDIFMEIIRL